jgi:hypothetical protein
MASLTKCTGRAAVPAGPISEAALVVGRRGGKSRVLALIAVYLACFRDYGPYLAPGEVATIAVLAANRPQARSIFRYISGILKAVRCLRGWSWTKTPSQSRWPIACLSRSAPRHFARRAGTVSRRCCVMKSHSGARTNPALIPMSKFLGLCVPAWRRPRAQYSCWLRRRAGSGGGPRRSQPIGNSDLRTPRPTLLDAYLHADPVDHGDDVSDNADLLAASLQCFQRVHRHIEVSVSSDPNPSSINSVSTKDARPSRPESASASAKETRKRSPPERLRVARTSSPMSRSIICSVRSDAAPRPSLYRGLNALR